MSAHGLGGPATGSPGATPATSTGNTNPATPQAGGQDPQAPAGATPQGQVPGPDEPLQAPGLAALQKEREAREAVERELAGYRQKEKEATEASMSEVERLQAENKRLKEEREAESRAMRQDRIRTRAEALATQAGWHRPQDAAAFLDFSQVTWDDKANEPTGLEEMLQAVVKDRAYLVQANTRPPSADAGRGTGGRTAPKAGMTDLIREAARRGPGR